MILVNNVKCFYSRERVGGVLLVPVEFGTIVEVGWQGVARIVDVSALLVYADTGCGTVQTAGTASVRTGGRPGGLTRVTGGPGMRATRAALVRSGAVGRPRRRRTRTGAGGCGEHVEVCVCFWACSPPGLGPLGGPAHTTHIPNSWCRPVASVYSPETIKIRNQLLL